MEREGERGATKLAPGACDPCAAVDASSRRMSLKFDAGGGVSRSSSAAAICSMSGSRTRRTQALQKRRGVSKN